MGRYSLTESPSWVTIYFATESPVSIIRAAQCGRSWPRHENMFVLFTAVTVTGAPEPRRWMRSHGSCWRHLDPATGQLLSQDKLRDDGVTARWDDQSHRVVSLLQNTGWPQKRQISRFAHCRDRACLFSKVSRNFHSAGWRLLSHNVPCLHCCVQLFFTSNISAICCFTRE